MTRHWICPDQLFDGGALQSDMALAIEAGQVTDLRSCKNLPDGTKCRRLPGILSPGYLDLQVNGGGGVLLNATPTADGMRTIAAAHRRFGTVGIMPTVITDGAEVLRQAVAAALDSKDQSGIIGLHIEGPHIAPARRGTHAADHIRSMSDETLAQVRKLRDAGVRVMITLAPEAVSADQIAALADTGAIVSIGHTAATAQEAQAAFAAGARAATHLFNAMSQMENRAPGVVGAVINSDVYAGIICDGHHVADEMIALACRARPVPGRMFLVSDAMSTVGGPDHFDLYGQKIRLQDGRLVNAEGSLAGAHVTQAEGVARLVSHVGIPVDEALHMAISVPAELVGAPELGQVSNRIAADLIVSTPELTFTGTLAEQLSAIAAE